MLGFLNAVFQRPAATGETFSRQGKTDIYLPVTGGNVLVGECKKWDGATLYQKTISQLFGYLTWRQTVGVMVTFSERASLTRVIDQAKRATAAHSTFNDFINTGAPSYFVSRHRHPADELKILELHHLCFDLQSR